MDEGDEITVIYGEQKFAPIQYQSFQLGPFYMKTKIRPGETAKEAWDRAYKFLETQARNTYPLALKDFTNRVHGRT